MKILVKTVNGRQNNLLNSVNKDQRKYWPVFCVRKIHKA